MTDTPPTRCGDIALAGLPNAGKSTLLNQLVGEHLAIVSPRAQTTRLPVTGVRTDGDTQYIFHDLPGLLEPGYLLQERMRDAGLATLAQADVVLHLHPAPDAPAPDLATLPGLAGLKLPPVLAVYTKGDLLLPAERPRLQGPGSLVTGFGGLGIPELLAELRARLPRGEFRFPEDEIGTQPLRFFVTEYLREAAFEALQDEVPYAFAASVEEFREAEQPVYIRVHLYVERESQKAILIGAGGRTIKAIGSHARRRIEALIGQPVYLDCWVKVLKNWRKNAGALAQLGFPAPPS